MPATRISVRKNLIKKTLSISVRKILIKKRFIISCQQFDKETREKKCYNKVCLKKGHYKLIMEKCPSERKTINQIKVEMKSFLLQKGYMTNHRIHNSRNLASHNVK